MATSPTQPNHSSLVPAESPTSAAAQEQVARRARGFTTGIAATRSASRLRSQRSFRILTGRGTDDAAPKKQTSDLASAGRSSSFISSSGRRPSQSVQTSLPRTQSFNNAVITASPHSPEKSFATHGRVLSNGDAQQGIQEGSYGVAPALASPFEPVPLSRKVSREESTSPATAVQGSGTDEKAVEGLGLVRLNSHSLKGQPARGTTSRRPSNHQLYTRSLGDHALDHLFTSFINQAEFKISDWGLRSHGDRGADFEKICGFGNDNAFDKLLSAIGHVAKANPSAIIERAILWRDSYSKAGVMRRFDGPQSQDSNDATSTIPREYRASAIPPGGEVSMAESETLIAGRRASVAAYLFCRLLMAILRQTTPQSLGASMLTRLQDMLYGQQLRAITSTIVNRFEVKKLQWLLLNETVAVLATLDFQGVSSRFLADLKVFQNDLSTRTSAKTTANSATEAEAIHLMRSMRFLRLPTGNEQIWKQSCSFMKTLADLFTIVHGKEVKRAFCKLVHGLLLPLASKVRPEFEQAEWKQVVGTLHSRLSHLVEKHNVVIEDILAKFTEQPADRRKEIDAEKSHKAKYWAVAFPAQAVVACVSPQDVFLRHWRQFFGTKQFERMLRERNHRGHVLKAACRIIWHYLERTNDSPEVVSEFLCNISRLTILSGKLPSLAGDATISEPLIELIKIVGYANEEFCFKSILFPLLDYDFLYEHDAKEIDIERIKRDKAVLGIRAFLAVFEALETKARPTFCLEFDDELQEDDPEQTVQTTLNVPPTPRKEPQPRRPMSLKSDPRTKPLQSDVFSETCKKYFAAFCDTLVKIAIICDRALDGNHNLETKAITKPSAALPAARSPMSESFSFNKRDEPADLMGEPYIPVIELIRVTIFALPRCSTSRNPQLFLNLLCSGTANHDKQLLSACVTSLRAIARQGYGLLVAERYSNFLASHADRVFDQFLNGAVLDPAILIDVLELYLDVLRIWLKQLHQVDKEHSRSASDETGTSSSTMSDAAVWSQVDRIEAQGLLFLCSSSHKVRIRAVQLLKLVVDFDTAMRQNNVRLARVISDNAILTQKLKDERLSPYERSILERGIRRGRDGDAIIELCCHNGEQENALWQKLFPSVIEASNSTCPIAVAQARDIIAARVSEMHPVVVSIEEARGRLTQVASSDNLQRQARPSTMTTISPVVMQWKFYLTFECITLTRTDPSRLTAQAQPNHERNDSKSSQSALQTLSTASDLFANVVPLLSATNVHIRSAAVSALGAINVNLYKTLLVALDRAGQSANNFRTHIANHQRAASSPRRAEMSAQFSVEFVQVYKLTARFLRSEEIRKDDWTFEHMARYTRDLAILLRRLEHENYVRRLRTSYCGLIEEFYAGIILTSEPERWMAFQSRRAAFALMEEWCNPSEVRDDMHIDRASRHLGLDFLHDGSGASASSWAHELSQLRYAAQSAMATLLAGPLRSVGASVGVVQDFNASRLLSWIDDMLKTESDRTHATAQRALRNLITTNLTYPMLLEYVVDKLYGATSAKALESYVEVISDVLMASDAPIVPFWKILSALLFILGSDRSTVRMKSARLLRFLDEQQRRGSKLQDLEISISDNTTAVNKKAHFEISQRLAVQHAEHAFHIFSEFSKHFSEIDADKRRNIVLSLLPWIKTIELQLLTQSGGVTASSYMLLVNLVQMTISFSATLHHEIQALWQALATGPHAGNVKLVLDFLIDLILSRKDAMLVQVAKHIVVFLSGTPAGQKVIESLLLQINPSSMWESGRAIRVPAGIEAFPYVADLAQVSPTASPIGGSNGPSNMSLGHLCLILLVDLIVAPVTLSAKSTTLLLHTVLILWDQRIEVVQDQAREMLVHLIHELVISKINDAAGQSQMQPIEDFIELIRHHDSRVIWTYMDNNGNHSDFELVKPMSFVINEVVRIFSITYPGIEEEWGAITMNWATACPVRHLACRSLQIYRCLLKPLDAKVISDLLSRLSSSVGDAAAITQTYSLDILRTLRTTIVSVNADNRPLIVPLFWTTWICLRSVNEVEFKEALEMLEALLGKVNLGCAVDVKALIDGKPPDINWNEETLISLVTQGCRSASVLDKCLALLEQLGRSSNHPFIGGMKGFHSTLLAYLPTLAHSIEDDSTSLQTTKAIDTLILSADSYNLESISNILKSLSANAYKTRQNFLIDIVEALKVCFYPILELEALTFVMGLLVNSEGWFRVEVLHILQLLVVKIDLNNQELMDRGLDLISPLLRLLQTDLTEPALELLDHFTGMPSIKDTHHQLEMSLSSTTSHPNRLRFENTQSLYGIPESSGWSIPMPAMRRESVRRDMHAVQNSVSGQTAPNVSPNPGSIEWYKEDRHIGSFFPEHTRAMTTDEAFLAETNVGELVSKLDDLDDFYDDVEPDETDSQQQQAELSDTSHHRGYVRNGPYDSFRNATTLNGNSQHSKPTAFRRTHIGRDPVVMSPSAFSAHRPDLQPRSMTSPPTLAHESPRRQRLSTPPTPRGTLYEEHEPFSESEDEITSNGRPSTSDGSFIMENNRQKNKLSWRNVSTGIRRFAQSRSRTRAEREREQSPEVPKVPQQWRMGRSDEL